MQEVVSPYMKSFLKCTCQSRLTECPHMGKADLPENAASAKQCKQMPISLTFDDTEWFF